MRTLFVPFLLSLLIGQPYPQRSHHHLLVWRVLDITGQPADVAACGRDYFKMPRLCVWGFPFKRGPKKALETSPHTCGQVPKLYFSRTRGGRRKSVDGEARPRGWLVCCQHYVQLVCLGCALTFPAVFATPSGLRNRNFYYTLDISTGKISRRASAEFDFY